MKQGIAIAVILMVAPFTPSLSGADITDSDKVLTDSVSIRFRVSRCELDTTLGDNAAALRMIDRRLTTMERDSVYVIRHVDIVGGASPEGSVEFNRHLSECRAATLVDRLSRYGKLTEADHSFTFLGRDWAGVLRLALTDPKLPFRDETLALLSDIASQKALSGVEPPKSLERMKRLRGGVPYRYLLRNIFPEVRKSRMALTYELVPSPMIMRPDPLPLRLSLTPDTLPVIGRIPLPPVASIPPRKPFYMAVKSNLIEDVALMPQLGAEFYLGKDWTIGGDWTYAWWSRDNSHRYWRMYGGELYARKWFGKTASEKPLTGHHLGLYAQIRTFDFEFGGKGYMGGKPGGDIWDRAWYGGGIEYGYSLSIGPRLNLDFSVGLGYLGGKYHKYIPKGEEYLCTKTSHFNWFGPTRAQISLSWLIGRGNVNPPRAKNNSTKGGDL